MTVTHYTSEDAKFFQYLDKEIFVGDVLDPSNSGHMSAGYYRNKRKGKKNEWCCQTNAGGSQCPAGSAGSDRKLAPLGQCGGAVLFEAVAAVEVAFLVEDPMGIAACAVTE